MHSNKTILWILLGMLFAAAMLVGCGAKGQPAEFEQTAGEMKEGPGLFTGEDGALVVYDSERGGAFPQLRGQKSAEGTKEDKKDAEAADTEKKAASDKPSGETRVAADKTSPKRDISSEEAKEFQAFQEWKKEQQSFKEFQEWKKSEEGKAEYQEFLEWKEWKSYQEWKKQQNQ
jgi:hypothetical protein